MPLPTNTLMDITNTIAQHREDTIKLEKDDEVGGFLEASSDDWSVIFTAIEQNPHINTLDLADALNWDAVDDDDYDTALTALAAAGLTSGDVDYDRNPHTVSLAIQEFSSQLANTTLQGISFRYNNIDPEDSRDIFNILKNNKSLRFLDFSYNKPVYDPGYDDDNFAMESLAELLKNEEVKIDDLNLQYDGITDLTIRPLILELNNLKLKKIDLSNNRIWGSGMLLFFQQLKDNKTLQTVSLAGNQILDSAVDTLIAALKTNKTLRSLDLSNNLISHKKVIKILETLKDNTTLEGIDIGNFGAYYNNQIGHKKGLASYSFKRGDDTFKSHPDNTDQYITPILAEEKQNLDHQIKTLSLQVAMNLKSNLKTINIYDEEFEPDFVNMLETAINFRNYFLYDKQLNREKFNSFMMGTSKGSDSPVEMLVHDVLDIVCKDLAEPHQYNKPSYADLIKLLTFLDQSKANEIESGNDSAKKFSAAVKYLAEYCIENTPNQFQPDVVMSSSGHPAVSSSTGVTSATQTPSTSLQPTEFAAAQSATVSRGTTRNE